MFDPNWPELTHPGRALGRGSRDRVPAFVARRGAFFVLLGVLLAQLLFLSVQITRGKNVRLIRIWAVAVFSPFERIVHGGIESTTNAWNTVRTLWSAQEENRTLKSDLSAAEIRIQQLSEQAAENTRLRGLLNLKTQLPFLSVAADVIATSPEEASSAVFIDRGKNDGLTTDLAVITPDGIVGKTVAVYAHTAQVLLITDPSSGAGCMIEKTRTEGILRGDTRNLCQLRYIMDDEKVSAGDAVVTSGLDQIYPKGLIVGSVVRVADGSIYKNIAVKPAAALDRLENVLVLLRPVPPPHEASPAPRP